MPVATEGPLLVAVMVKVTSSPTSGAGSSTDLVTPTSVATGICACTGPAVTICPMTVVEVTDAVLTR